MYAYVDTHCHLEMHDELSVAEQVERARDAGVTTLVTVGTSMASSTQAVRTAHQMEGIWASVGIHPNDAMEATPKVLEVIEKLAEQEAVVAVGETGLDYYRDHTSPEQQMRSLRHHIELARRQDKALVVHCREAWPDLLRILDEEDTPERVVLHCFSGDRDVVRHCAERGWFMSFAGNLTFKNAEELRVAAAGVPLELLLTETDSPFLSPHPHRGKPNDPSRVHLVLETLAEIQHVASDELADTVLGNARRAFRLPDGG